MSSFEFSLHSLTQRIFYETQVKFFQPIYLILKLYLNIRHNVIIVFVLDTYSINNKIKSKNPMAVTDEKAAILMIWNLSMFVVCFQTTFVMKVTDNAYTDLRLRKMYIFAAEF